MREGVGLVGSNGEGWWGGRGGAVGRRVARM